MRNTNGRGACENTASACLHTGHSINDVVKWEYIIEMNARLLFIRHHLILPHTLIHEVGKANCNAVTVLPRGSAHFAKLDVLLVYDSLRNHRDNHKGNHAKVGIGVQFLMTINRQQHAAGNI